MFISTQLKLIWLTLKDIKSMLADVLIFSLILVLISGKNYSIYD